MIRLSVECGVFGLEIVQDVQVLSVGKEQMNVLVCQKSQTLQWN